MKGGVGLVLITFREEGGVGWKGRRGGGGRGLFVGEGRWQC